MAEVERSYTWYADLLCRDLGLKQAKPGDWVFVNRGAEMADAIARYYLAHPEYGRVGREMIVVAMLTSFESLLLHGHPAPEMQGLMRRAVGRALDDIYDRDAVRPYWDTAPTSGDPCPLYGWLREQFSGLVLPPSVWSKEGR